MKRLLLVDDDKLMLRSLERALKGKVLVLSTTSAKTALKTIEHNQQSGGGNLFDALVTELHMNEMSGLELAGMARQYGVESVTVMTSDPSLEPVQSCGFNVLRKPFGLAELANVWSIA